MREYLIQTAELMGISISEEQAKKFEAYHRMLTNTNSEMNLTRIGDDLNEACDRNYLDSLTLLPYLCKAESLIDVGSGAGFPGIPISIMRPDIGVTLIDSLKKRVEFLNSVIEELKLNATAIHIRCEQAAADDRYREAYDVATARAVARMDVLSEWLLPFVKIGGRMLALKGPIAVEETCEAEFAVNCLGGKTEGIYDAEIPNRDWQHKIVSVRKVNQTPGRFPRKPGIAEKRPLREK